MTHGRWRKFDVQCILKVMIKSESSVRSILAQVKPAIAIPIGESGINKSVEIMRSLSQLTILKMVCKVCVSVALIFGTGLFAKEIDVDALQQQVRDAEIAFAQTMSDRDFEAFKTFVSEEAVFLSGKTASRGRIQVAESWKEYYQGEEAPFSWRPETVVALGSGNLALSTGPVFNSAGKLISYYTSTWRLEAPGVWRVVFDKGNKACDTDK